MKTQIIWSCLVIAISTIELILCIRRKPRIKPTVWFGWILFFIIGFALGVSAFIFPKLVSFCAISFGITMIKSTYYEIKHFPASKWTNTYQSQLMGYVAGIGALVYGILKLFFSP